mmetsp:Transcript_27480/g.51495  ORF Transcript_27480/g.51495 Transcript_27480/m.51495 type:complete len:381 (+) Transcript_27480:1733-2875(+)
MGRAFPCASLQHVELSLLDSKFNVLHVLVVVLQLLADGLKLLEDVGHHFLQGRQVASVGLAGFDGQLLGCADACHHVLALGIHQELSVEVIHAVRRISGEGHTSGAIVAHVSKDHGLNVHCRAPLFWDVVKLAVGLGPLVHPGAENSSDRAPELLMRLLRELLPKLQVDAILVLCHQLLQVCRQELMVLLHASLLLGTFQELLKVMELDPQHHVRVHLNEAPIAVKGKTPISRLFGQSLCRGIVEAQVQDSVHHARHGGAGAGAHRHQERVRGIPKRAAGPCFNQVQGLRHLILQTRGVLAVILIVVGANFGGEGEAWGHRQPNGCHLRQVRALAAQQVLHFCTAVGIAGTEVVDPRHVRTNAKIRGMLRRMLRHKKPNA